MIGTDSRVTFFLNSSVSEVVRALFDLYHSFDLFLFCVCSPLVCAGLRLLRLDMSKLLFLALFGLCLGLLSAFPAFEEHDGKNWVVLVAGSNGWYNYRHQVRDLCATILRTWQQSQLFTTSLPTCCPPGRSVPCLPDCSQERHPRRADCGHDVRWPSHARWVSFICILTTLTQY